MDLVCCHRCRCRWAGTWSSRGDEPEAPPPRRARRPYPAHPSERRGRGRLDHHRGRSSNAPMGSRSGRPANLHCAAGVRAPLRALSQGDRTMGTDANEAKPWPRCSPPPSSMRTGCSTRRSPMSTTSWRTGLPLGRPIPWGRPTRTSPTPRTPWSTGCSRAGSRSAHRRPSWRRASISRCRCPACRRATWARVPECQGRCRGAQGLRCRRVRRDRGWCWRPPLLASLPVCGLVAGSCSAGTRRRPTASLRRSRICAPSAGWHAAHGRGGDRPARARRSRERSRGAERLAVSDSVRSRPACLGAWAGSDCARPPLTDWPGVAA
jgi:hypothetical protein